MSEQFTPNEHYAIIDYRLQVLQATLNDLADREKWSEQQHQEAALFRERVLRDIAAMQEKMAVMRADITECQRRSEEAGKKAHTEIQALQNEHTLMVDRAKTVLWILTPVFSILIPIVTVALQRWIFP